MADSPSRRPWVVLALVAAVVAAVLLVGIGGGDDGGDGAPGAADPSPSATAEPGPAPAGPVTPDEFCASFRTFADASNTVVASPTAASGQALVEVSRTLFEMPTPLGMTDGARAALDQLVAGSLAGVEGVGGVTVDTAPDPAYDAEPDQAALDEYLRATCPA